MTYRDPLEAAHARIRALECELAEYAERFRTYQNDLVAAQDARSHATTAAMNAQARVARVQHDHELALANLRLELERCKARCAELEARLDLEQRTHRANAENATALRDVLVEELEVLQRMSPELAIELYERRAEGLRANLSRVDAEIAKASSEPAPENEVDREAREHLASARASAREAMRADLEINEAKAAAMRTNLGKRR